MPLAFVTSYCAMNVAEISGGNWTLGSFWPAVIYVTPSTIVLLTVARISLRATARALRSWVSGQLLQESQLGSLYWQCLSHQPLLSGIYVKWSPPQVNALSSLWSWIGFFLAFYCRGMWTAVARIWGRTSQLEPHLSGASVAVLASLMSARRHDRELSSSIGRDSGALLQ